MSPATEPSRGKIAVARERARLVADVLDEQPCEALVLIADVPPPAWKPGAAVAVVLAGGGYPETSASGDPIRGLDDAAAVEGVHVIQAGTALSDGDLVTAGGRVLAVVATGRDLAAARDAAYTGARLVEFDGVQYRTDIARAAADGQPATSAAPQPVETPSREGTR